MSLWQLWKLDGGDSRTLSLYGQEKNLTTQSIARMNMYIHNLPDHNIMRGDTLREPKFTDGDALKQFDVVIAKRWMTPVIQTNGVCDCVLAA